MTDHVSAARKRADALKMWACGADSQSIADALGYGSQNGVRRLISRARKMGDKRAVKRTAGRPAKRRAVLSREIEQRIAL